MPPYVKHPEHYWNYVDQVILVHLVIFCQCNSGGQACFKHQSSVTKFFIKYNMEMQLPIPQPSCTIQTPMQDTQALIAFTTNIVHSL